MKRIWFVSVCIFLAMGLWAVSINQTFAQTQEEKEEIKGKKSAKDKWVGKDREEIEEMVESLRIVKMTEVLNLSEEQSIKVFTKMGQIKREKKDLQKKRIEAMQSIRGLIDSGTSEEKLKEAVENIKSLANSIKDQDDALIKYLEGILSVEQQAKYIIFTEDFQKDIRKMIGHAHDLRGKQREEIDASRRERRKDLDIPPQPEGMEPEQ